MLNLRVEDTVRFFVFYFEREEVLIYYFGVQMIRAHRLDIGVRWRTLSRAWEVRRTKRRRRRSLPGARPHPRFEASRDSLSAVRRLAFDFNGRVNVIMSLVTT